MHFVISHFILNLGGDTTSHDGFGGYSIYGEKFNDENFILKFDNVGLLAMANSGFVSGLVLHVYV